MRKLRKNLKAISPVLSALMMIIVAIAASLVTYAWVMGYLSFTTSKAGKAIQIQSIALNATTGQLKVFVQNIGDSNVTFLDDQCLYIKGVMQSGASADKPNLDPGNTATITLADQGYLIGDINVKIKVVTQDGTFTEATKSFE